MRLPLKLQVTKLIEHCAYQAFGFRPETDSFKEVALETDSQGRDLYKVATAKQIYEQYRKDDFRYADQGMTPQIIAEDILLHFNPQSHLDVEIDQWGCLLVKVQDSYFESYISSVIQKGTYSLHECAEFSKVKHILKGQSDPEHKVMLSLRYEPNKISLSDLRMSLFLNTVQKVQDQLFESQFSMIDLQQAPNLQPEQTSLFIAQELKRLMERKRSTQVSVTCACLRHELTKTEKLINRSFDLIAVSSCSLNISKFGTVFPDELTVEDFSALEKTSKEKLVKLFLQNEPQLPLHLEQHTNSPQAKTAQFKSISSLILELEECLFNNNFTELYRAGIFIQRRIEQIRQSPSLGQQPNKQEEKHFLQIVLNFINHTLFQF